jgi:Putative zinc-finger
VPTNKQDLNQFGSAKPTQSGDPQHCAQCEAMLTDALDGTLSPADQAAFDLHLLSCIPCSSMMSDAQRGAAWLEMLKFPRPEPSAQLLDRIFAQTSGQTSGATSTQISPIPAPYLVPSNTLLGRPALSGSGISLQASNVIPFRSRFANFNLRSIGHTLLQPRLAMTAAMAFFSIALTMNLTGVRFSELRASDLRPSSLKRSFYEANAHVVRYYDNLRVVYELESRVHDLQHASDSDSDSGTPAPATTSPSDSTSKPAQKPSGDQPATQPDQQDQQQQQKQSRPRPSPGSSRRESPIGNIHQVVADTNTRNLFYSPTPYLTQPLATLLPGSEPGNTPRRVQEGRLV